MNLVDISVRKVQLQIESVHSVTVTGFSKDIDIVLDYLIGYEKVETSLQNEQKVPTISVRGEFKIYKSSKSVHTDNSSGSVDSGYSGHSFDPKDLTKDTFQLPVVPPQFFVPIPTPQPQRATGTLVVGGSELDKSNCTNWPIKHNMSPQANLSITIPKAPTLIPLTKLSQMFVEAVEKDDKDVDELASNTSQFLTNLKSMLAQQNPEQEMKKNEILNKKKSLLEQRDLIDKELEALDNQMKLMVDEKKQQNLALYEEKLKVWEDAVEQLRNLNVEKRKAMEKETLDKEKEWLDKLKKQTLKM